MIAPAINISDWNGSELLRRALAEPRMVRRLYAAERTS
jgi:hypothetical protein